MRALIWHGTHDVRVDTVDDPEQTTLESAAQSGETDAQEVAEESPDEQN